MFTAPQKKTPWLVAGKSDTGIARHTNEDAFFCGFPSGGSGFAVIADGVGGLEFGERASSTAVEGVRRHFEKTEFPVPARPDFAALFRALDAEIEALGEKLVPGFCIASTLDVVAAGADAVLHFAHLGDSGIFMLRGNDLTRLSEEHTLAAEERARGNRDFPPVYNNTLTRALGIGVDPNPQAFSLQTRPGDRFLLATDGITRALPPEKISALVGNAPAPEAAAAALVAAANEAGGHDNATAVLLFA